MSDALSASQLALAREQERSAVGGLAAAAAHELGSPLGTIAIAAVVEAAAAGHRRAGIELRFEAAVAAGAGSDSRAPGAAPVVPLGAEIIHGIGNLVQNAVQFAATRVVVRTRWAGQDITVSVTDDGPGFPQFVLERLGEPYISMRTDEGEHMGLGIFIAQILLQRTGAELEFRNHADGGAEVVIRCRRGVLETGAEE